MSGFACMECGHKFKTIKAAEKASFGDKGCPKCGGSDIDLASIARGRSGATRSTAGAARPIGYRCRGCGTTFKRKPGSCIVCARRGRNETAGETKRYPVRYTDGSAIADPIAVIGDDLSTERRGNWYRAYWTESLESNTQSSVFGYASGQGGPHRTVMAAAAEVRRYYPAVRIYRASDGRRVS